MAVSGGADSVYLLCALWGDEAMRPRLRVLHFDHRARGEASAEDARFVAALCAALGVPCEAGKRAGQGAASEADLRSARDGFFAERRKVLGHGLLCTAHHLDDVVENALLRLARGAGLAGLAAPRALQEFRDGHRRWRPLIEAGITKSALLAGLRSAGIPWREDATNLLPVATRNRIRGWLAAGGESALGVGYAEGFGKSARIIGEAQAALADWAKELGCVVGSDGIMPVSALRGRPPALIQECLRAFLYFHGISEPGAESLRPLAVAIAAGGDALDGASDEEEAEGDEDEEDVKFVAIDQPADGLDTAVVVGGLDAPRASRSRAAPSAGGAAKKAPPKKVDADAEEAELSDL